MRNYMQQYLQNFQFDNVKHCLVKIKFKCYYFYYIDTSIDKSYITLLSMHIISYLFKIIFYKRNPPLSLFLNIFTHKFID